MGAPELQWVADEDLASKLGLYPEHEINAERARRAGRYYQSVSLRAEDHPARDPWDVEKQRLRHDFDPVSHAGLQASSPGMLGDFYDVETRRRAQELARSKQAHRFAVAVGASLKLRDGTVLGEGAGVTVEQIDHPHAIEILNALVGRRVLSEIDPLTAFMRSLPADVGPYVVIADALQVGARTLRRGDACSPETFPAPPAPRITDAMSCGDITVGELRDIIAAQVRCSQPGFIPPPPPMSEFEAALTGHMIERCPNYVAPAIDAAPKRKGIFK